MFLKIVFDGFRVIKMFLASCLKFSIVSATKLKKQVSFLCSRFLTTFCNLNQSPPEV
ncbi:unnamed protein product [Brassica rapa]|uniref:Uncharacterized protein n=2 Tax=Brassica TaxID=3705 RepID=A0A8D9HMT0_BRACM|nr:unnamed protein product [Brassica napus]CAG7902431.1 unnamed protein product [Brassica rapa]